MNQVTTHMQDIASLPGTSRVWIYQADGVVPDAAVDTVRSSIQRFTTDWTSHNVMLKAAGDLIHQRFVVLAVNEMHAGVSGCSIDASVQFMRDLGSQLGMDFMDRLNFAYVTATNEIRAVHKDALAELYRSGEINDQTLFFDNLVNTRDDFESRWMVPLGESWMKRLV